MVGFAFSKCSTASRKIALKIVAGGNQMMNPLTPYEAFGNYPQEQRRLIDFIKEARVEGVLFLSGDRHYTELIKRTEPGIYPLYDFTSSSLTSGTSEPTEEEANNPARVPGRLVKKQHNFGLIEASGTTKNRRLILRTLDVKDRELWRHEIGANELTFEKSKGKTV